MYQVSNLQPLNWLLLASLLAGCSHYQGLSNLRSRHNNYRASGDLVQAEFQSSEIDALESPKNFTRKGTPLLQWPVDQSRLSQRFAPPSNPSHQGIDLAAPLGSPVFAAHEGTVIYAGQGYSGYGKMVLLEYNTKWATLYAHFDQIFVKEGHLIKQGQLIGEMGRTGRATGVHLHFELMKNKLPVNPLNYLEKQFADLRP